MNESTKSWLEFAIRDIKVAEEILENEYFSNIVTFHCQQAVEKILKAVLEEYATKVPKIHSLLNLYNLIPFDILSSLNVKEDDLKIIDKVYIDSRYPLAIGLLPSGFPSKEDAKEIFEIAKNIFDEILKLLEKKED